MCLKSPYIWCWRKTGNPGFVSACRNFVCLGLDLTLTLSLIMSCRVDEKWMGRWGWKIWLTENYYLYTLINVTLTHNHIISPSHLLRIFSLTWEICCQHNAVKRQKHTRACTGTHTHTCTTVCRFRYPPVLRGHAFPPASQLHEVDLPSESLSHTLLDPADWRCLCDCHCAPVEALFPSVSRAAMEYGMGESLVEPTCSGSLRQSMWLLVV